MAIVTHHYEIYSFPWVKSSYIRQLAYATFGRHYLTETIIFVQVETSLKNYFLFFLDGMMMLISTFVFLFNFHRFHLLNS